MFKIFCTKSLEILQLPRKFCHKNVILENSIRKQFILNQQLNWKCLLFCRAEQVFHLFVAEYENASMPCQSQLMI